MAAAILSHTMTAVQSLTGTTATPTTAAANATSATATHRSVLEHNSQQ